MKISCNYNNIDYAIEFDSSNIKNKLIEFFNSCKDFYTLHKKDIYTFAFIDDRYYSTIIVNDTYSYQAKYIISYATVKLSLAKINKILKENLDNSYYTNGFISDLFEEKYIIEDSGELNGYELDTPDLKTFDFIIKI